MPADDRPADASDASGDRLERDDVQALRGRLVRARINVGSKSERNAMLLELGDGQRVTLRRAGGNPFRDPQLEALEGQCLRVEGRMQAGCFVASRLDTEDAPPA